MTSSKAVSDSRKDLNPIGLILRSQRTGMTFVPYERTDSWYSCVVVDPGESEQCRRNYPIGGHNIIVSARECADSVQVEQMGALLRTPLDRPETPILDKRISDLVRSGVAADIHWGNYDAEYDGWAVELVYGHIRRRMGITSPIDAERILMGEMNDMRSVYEHSVSNWVDDVKQNPPYKC